YTNMDFVDIDWEYPCDVRQPDLVDNKNDEGTPNATKADKENYIKLLQEFRTELDKQGNELNKGYELSVAIPAPKSKVDLGIDIKNLFNIVDFTNIMTYDMRGAWDEYSGHQTSLYPNENDPIKGNNLSIDETVDYLVDKGAEKDKIVIGAADYTSGWDKVEKGSNNSLPGIFNKASITTKDADQTPSRGAVNEAPLASGDGGRMSGVWSYRSLDKLKSRYPGLKEYWDDTAKAPYLYDESTGKLFTYDNVKSITEKTKSNKIAIGHNLNDQAETILMRMMRGTGLQGLKGIEYKRDNTIIRPILDIERSSIENYCEEYKLNPRIDSTNLENIYTRNKIRLELIPYMQENFNSNVVESICRMGNNLKLDSEYLEQEGINKFSEIANLKDKEQVEIPLDKYINFHKAIKTRIIRNSIKYILGDTNFVDQKHIEDVLDLEDDSKVNKKLVLPRGLYVYR
ncbi:MAG: tRNA lysidine(34) synthetase TilS, partial [Peptostreptococcaceae bacterium]|nr:tRNA lysidine(34) synthetase TilS [Peptostreptococcaceae bacterium]